MPNEGWFEVSGDGWEEPRFYDINGLRLRSVTTILSVISKPYLAQWRGRVGNEEAKRITEETGMFGQDVHDMVAMVNMGLDPDVPPDLEPLKVDYKKWFERTVEEVVEVELEVYSLEWEYAGRLDAILRIKGDVGLTLTDVKTGTIDKVPAAQTAAYVNAYQEMTGEEIKRRLVLPLSRRENRMKKPIEYRNQRGDFNAFLWATGLDRWMGR